MPHQSDKLGTQVWLEPADDEQRIERLFELVVEGGHRWVRLFINWVWIEEQPGEWDFSLYDKAFAAAASRGILIKATLTANTPPWHLGSPGMLHTFNGFLNERHQKAAEDYIKNVVVRYRDNDALGQWIIWNEPRFYCENSELTLKKWKTWLAEKYANDLSALNKRWRTGYEDFQEIPVPEEVPHPDASNMNSGGRAWLSYRPSLDWLQFLTGWLSEQLRWVAEQLRQHDPKTTLCVNPTENIANQPSGATDLDAISSIVDVIGASYHPAYSFTFAKPSDFPGLMAAGIRQQLAMPSTKEAEVTEVQSGNTFSSSTKAAEPSPPELARYYLASLAAGARSVTGWCFNSRHYDYEAGDWSLLNDDDSRSPRFEMVKRLAETLSSSMSVTGDWNSHPADGYIIADPVSQAIELVDITTMTSLPGRHPADSACGAGIMASSLMNRSVLPDLTRVDFLPRSGAGKFLILPHTVAWKESWGEAILEFAHTGGTVLWDGIGGRKDEDAHLYRPWPAGNFAQKAGLKVLGITSQANGFPFSYRTYESSRFLGARAKQEFDHVHWEAHDDYLFDDDLSPVFLSRTYGKGKLIYSRGMLAPSIVYEDSFRTHAPGMLTDLLGLSQVVHSRPRLVMAENEGILLPVSTKTGPVYVVLANSIRALVREGCQIILPKGRWHDDWSNRSWNLATEEIKSIPLPDGIMILRQQAD